MRKVLRVLTVIAATTALCGVILSAAYTQMVEKEVTRLRRESRSDIVYLRTRVRELESELTAGLLAHREDCQPPDDLPVGGGVEEETAEDGTETETETMSETAENGESEAPSETESDGETVTVPTHNSPETQEPTETLPENDAPVALYVLTVYNGVIGVFDASGELVQTVNVFVMTLPESEQEALTVGIPAYSEEEMRQIVERFE